MSNDEMTRREAVSRVGLIGAAGVLLATPGFADSTTSQEDKEVSVKIEHNEDVMAMKFSDWQKLANESFEVTGHSFAKSANFKKTTVKLIDVDDHKHQSDKLRPKSIRQSGYSLVFQAPLDANFDSRTHSIVHKKLGTFHLHLQLVPRGADHKQFLENKKKHRFYEAVIN